MNYLKIYNQLIDKAINNTRKKKQGTYYEEHHIIPVVIGGTNDKNNLVLLTGREHFIAHQLLHKVYPKEFGLLYAVDRMNRKKSTSSKQYEWIKEKYAKEMSIKQTGKKYSDETNKKKASFGLDNGMYNRAHSNESKQLMSEKKKLLVGELHPHYGKESKLKGKTYEEIVGKEKAKSLKDERSKSLTGIKRPYNEGENNPAKRDEVRQKISEARSNPIEVNGVTYNSIKDAIEKLNMSRYKIKKLIKD